MTKFPLKVSEAKINGSTQEQAIYIQLRYQAFLVTPFSEIQNVKFLNPLKYNGNFKYHSL
jgi:hypothetical protein